MISLRAHTYHQPFETLNTAKNEDLSASAVATETAAAGVFLAYP